MWHTVETSRTAGNSTTQMLNRAQALEHIRDKHFDLCVIGGGATGSACALDAQLRGIHTVLLEAGDFAGATSSASTKIVHGGIRYLEEAIRRADVKEYRVLVRALRERAYMLHNAPHLAHELEFLVPAYRWRDIAYLEIGLKLYDWLAGSARLAPSQFLSKQETLRRMPDLKPERLVGSVVYSDGQFDDARYNLAMVRTFCAAGGQATNYARVTDFLRDTRGKLVGVIVHDDLSEQTFVIHTKIIVNATGIRSDSIRQLANPDLPVRMRPSKGAHILLPLDTFVSKDALLIPKTDDGRVLFAIPWNSRLLVGTTEEDVSPVSDMNVTQEDVDFLLRHLNRYLAKPCSRNDVASGFAGARPLVASDNTSATKDLARDDVIEVDAASGLISIMGGKWTTHRAMGEDTINSVQTALGVPRTNSLTRDHILLGGQGFTSNYWQTLSSNSISEQTARHLASRYGTEANAILEIATRNPNLASLIVSDFPAILAEVAYSVQQEMALTVEDIIARRIGLQSFSWRKSIEAAPVVASLLAQELGWSSAKQHDAIRAYTSKINRLIISAGLKAEA